LSSGRRDFTSVGVMWADRYYAIVADKQVADSAARRLAEGR
jgi:hypothetical protein